MSIDDTMKEFIAAHGPWSAHQTKLADDCYTMGSDYNENHLLYVKRDQRRSTNQRTAVDRSVPVRHPLTPG